MEMGTMVEFNLMLKQILGSVEFTMTEGFFFKLVIKLLW